MNKKYIFLIAVLSLIFTTVFVWKKINPKNDMLLRDRQRKDDLVIIQKGLAEYYKNNYSYPKSSVGRIVGCGGEACIWGYPWDDGNIRYLEKMPYDPLSSQSYLYSYDEQTKSYTIEACLENLKDRSGIKTDNTRWCKNGLVYKVGSR